MFRQSHGPGWALVGDAGYVRDPCTAQGITDSFRDAELLARALDDALAGRVEFDRALAGYQTARDAAVKAMFNFTMKLAAMEPMPFGVRMMFTAMQGDQPAMDRFMGSIAGTVPLPQFLNPVNVGGIMVRGLTRRLRGSLSPSSAPGEAARTLP